MSRVTFFCVLLALCTFGASALAQPLVARPLRGDAPLELVPESTGFLGHFTVENRGSEPIKVTRVGPRPGTGAIPRLPANLDAAFEDGKGEQVLAPGASRRVVVRWAASRERGPEEIHGHIVVESDAGQVAIGVHADRRTSFLTDHALSLLVIAPLLGLLLLGALYAGRYQKLRNLRFVPLGVAIAQLVLSAVVLYELDPTLTQYQGGGGFQFVEAAPLFPGLGIQYLLGLDGISLGPVLLAPVLLLLAALSGDSVDSRPLAVWSWLLVLEAALLGALVALDLALVLVLWVVAAIAMIFLIGGKRPAAYLALCTALIALAFFQLSRTGGAMLLLDGSSVASGFAFTELMHLDLARTGNPKLAFSALLIGSMVLLAAYPLHGWLVLALGRLPAPVGMVIAGSTLSFGAYVLVRFGYGLLPHAVSWASTTIAAVGVVGGLCAALAATAERDVARFAGYVTAVHAGFVLLAASSLTGIGVQSALASSAFAGLAVALVVLSAGVLRDRVSSSDGDRFGGLARELPLFSVLAGGSFVASMALPGTAPFAAQLLALTGGFARHPGLVVVALLVAVVSIVAHGALYARLFFGALPDEWRRSRFLEAHGGRFPRLRSRETGALGLGCILVILLGFMPGLLLDLTASSAQDYADRASPPGPTQVAALPADERLALKSPTD